jgi:hypothetical protein
MNLREGELIQDVALVASEEVVPFPDCTDASVDGTVAEVEGESAESTDANDDAAAE